MKTKSTRGRRKGSVSFVAVALGDLNAVLKEGGTVLVSRLWAESIGIAGKPIVASAKNMDAHVPVLPKTDEDGVVNVKKNQW